MFRKQHKLAMAISAVVVTAVLLATAYSWRRHQQEQSVKFVETLLSMDARPSWKSRLPPSATEVQEWSWADGFLPDYSCQLKARITEPEFRKFVTDLGLTPHTSERTYSESSWLSWYASPGFEGDWRDPTDDVRSTYVSEGEDTWTYAKFENGFLYFKSLNH